MVVAVAVGASEGSQSVEIEGMDIVVVAAVAGKDLVEHHRKLHIPFQSPEVLKDSFDTSFRNSLLPSSLAFAAAVVAVVAGKDCKRTAVESIVS